MKRRQVITWTAPIVMAVTLPAHAVTSEEPMPLPPIVVQDFPEDMPEPIVEQPECERLVVEIIKVEEQLDECMDVELSSFFMVKAHAFSNPTCADDIEYLRNYLEFAKSSLETCKAIS